MLPEQAIEEYQVILLRNPAARVFAPLSEAYRKMGLLQQALEVCEKGVDLNKTYPSGRVALGKVLFELERYDEAAAEFLRAHELQKDNILAIKLCALAQTKLQNNRKAVDLYKKVLLLNPKDPSAIDFLRNWEFLEAEEYSSATADISIKPSIFESLKNPSQTSAYIEALIARNELDDAESLLRYALKKWPDDLLLSRQLQVVLEFLSEEQSEGLKGQLDANRKKQEALKSLLRLLTENKE